MLRKKKRRLVLEGGDHGEMVAAVFPSGDDARDHISNNITIDDADNG